MWIAGNTPMRDALLRRRVRAVGNEEQAMKVSQVFALVFLSIASAAALAQQPGQPASRLGREDKDASSMKVTTPEFVKKAGASGLAEVELGKLGSQKATNPEVKAFAEHMVTDHSAANQELAAAAKSKGLEVPMAPESKHKAAMEKLQGKSADDFDQEFMQQMVKDHKDAVALFEAVSKNDKVDPDMRALAAKTLPKLQEHLKEAQALERKL
jgi:putative membrane protein